METAGEPVIYQLRVVLEGISPLIWRRLIVPVDYSIADLHFILQIAFEWDDWNLHRFFIHGKGYGIYHSGGMSFSDDPSQVKLADFKLRRGEKFLYEYDFFNGRKHLLRIIEVAEILKKKYGSKLIDLLPAERSQNYLLGDCLSAWDLITSFRDCIGLSQLPNLSTESTAYRKTIACREVIIEKPDIKKIGYSDSRSAHDLSKLPRLNKITQLPEILSDDDLVFVWDEQEAEPIPQIVIRYGNLIVWKEFSYYQCCDRFEPIAMLLQQKYGKKVKDLIPTRRSEANLLGGGRGAEFIIGKVQGNLWMSRYALDSEDIASEAVKDNSDKFISNNQSKGNR